MGRPLVSAPGSRHTIHSSKNISRIASEVDIY